MLDSLKIKVRSCTILDVQRKYICTELIRNALKHQKRGSIFFSYIARVSLGNINLIQFLCTFANLVTGARIIIFSLAKLLVRDMHFYIWNIDKPEMWTVTFK